MRLKKRPGIRGFEEDFLAHDFDTLDPESEYFDEEEAMESGWKASDLGFLRGCRDANRKL